MCKKVKLGLAFHPGLTATELATKVSKKNYSKLLFF